MNEEFNSIEEAQKYFDSIPDKARVLNVKLHGEIKPLTFYKSEISLKEKNEFDRENQTASQNRSFLDGGKVEGKNVKKKKKNKRIIDELLNSFKKTFSDFIIEKPIHYDEHGLWWAWDEENKKWIMIDSVDVLNKVEDFFELKTEQISKFSNFFINLLKQKARRHKPQELPEYCIQFKDKIYDLKNKKEFPASAKYFTTAPIPYALSESSDTPTIDKLFIQWVGEEHQEELYEVLSYSCIKEQFLQTIIALTGSGCNGKGTFQNLIIKFLGKENCSSSSIKSLINRSFETSALYKKPVCMIGEVDKNDLSNTNTIKQLTGEDLIRYEFKGKTTFSEKSETTFIIATNSLPKTPDKSDGFYRRWFIIDFPNQFKVKRDLLAEIPEEEMRNLTRKVVDCLLNLLEENNFTNGGDIEERRKRYEQRSNPLMIFINENYDEEGVGYVKLREFGNNYNQFLKSKKLRIETISKIGKDLREEGFEISTRKYKNEDGEIVDSAKSIIGLTEKNKQLVEEIGGSGGNEKIKPPKPLKSDIYRQKIVNEGITNEEIQNFDQLPLWKRRKLSRERGGVVE